MAKTKAKAKAKAAPEPKPKPVPQPRGAQATDIIITERGTRESCLGPVMQLKVFAPGYRQLSWSEVWEKFTETYPGHWAVQVFPPADQLIDAKCVYHLFVCENEPNGLNLR